MDNERLRRLICSAGGALADVEVAVKEIGADEVGAVVLRELLDRADFAGASADSPVVIRIVLGASVWAVTVDSGVAQLAPGDVDSADVTVSQELSDLVRGVFGPAAARTNCTRTVRWPDSPAVGRSTGGRFSQVSHLLHRLLVGSQTGPVDLTELVLRFGSDKWGFHHYTGHYDRYFSSVRDLPVTVLELGIGGYGDPASGGGSLRAWKRYFHRGLVFGVDIVDKSPLDSQRLFTRKGDQSDPVFLDALIAETGAPDIVIDDGSHQCAHVIASFRHLFPKLAAGGVYVIEDVQTSYWEHFGGSSSRLTDADTTMGYFKSLVDGVNHSELDPDGTYQPTGFEKQISGVHFFHNLVFVEKSANDEGTLPGFVAGRPIASR